MRGTVLYHQHEPPSPTSVVFEHKSSWCCSHRALSTAAPRRSSASTAAVSREPSPLRAQGSHGVFVWFLAVGGGSQRLACDTYAVTEVRGLPTLLPLSEPAGTRRNPGSFHVGPLHDHACDSDHAPCSHPASEGLWV